MYVKSVSKSHKVESELWITQVHWSQVIYRFEKSHISQTSTRLLTLLLTHSMERKISLQQGSTLIKFHNTHPNCDFIDNHDYKILDENKT